MASPLTDGVIGQPIFIYLRQTGVGYHVIDPGVAAIEFPRRAYEDLQRPACGMSAEILDQLQRLRARHRVPDITF